MPTRFDSHVLQPADVAHRWDCDVESIYSLIKKGVLPAFSTSPPGAKRPTWRILASVVEAYESGRTPSADPPPPARRRKRDAAIKRFFR